MERKYEQAITLMMEEIGYYWCEKCEEWRKEEDRFLHEENH